ncbi:MAG: hypothetical protein IID51_06570 [Proteobacteria bacterium]|nr:hypothetical protein [Pseudomonadota bacterium]
MIKARTIATIVFGAFLVAACSSPARRGPPQQRPNMDRSGAQVLLPASLLFASFDADGNYKINNEEVDAGLLNAFDQADADGSGKLSLFEYRNWAAQALGATNALPGWIGIDLDGDHSISESEYRQAFLGLASNYGLADPDGISFAKLTRNMVSARQRAEQNERRPDKGRQDRRRRPRDGGKR